MTHTSPSGFEIPTDTVNSVKTTTITIITSLPWGHLPTGNQSSITHFISSPTVHHMGLLFSSFTHVCNILDILGGAEISSSIHSLPFNCLLPPSPRITVSPNYDRCPPTSVSIFSWETIVSYRIFRVPQSYNTVSSEANDASKPQAILEGRGLWKKFHQLGTEMIVTKSGRQVMRKYRNHWSLISQKNVPHPTSVVCTSKSFPFLLRSGRSRECWWQAISILIPSEQMDCYWTRLSLLLISYALDLCLL